MLPLSLIFLFQHKFIERPGASPKPAGAVAEDAADDDPMKTGGVAPIVWMVTLSIGIVGCCISMALPIAHIVSRVTNIWHLL